MLASANRRRSDDHGSALVSTRVPLIPHGPRGLFGNNPPTQPHRLPGCPVRVALASVNRLRRGPPACKVQVVPVLLVWAVTGGAVGAMGSPLRLGVARFPDPTTHHGTKTLGTSSLWTLEKISHRKIKRRPAHPGQQMPSHHHLPETMTLPGTGQSTPGATPSRFTLSRAAQPTASSPSQRSAGSSPWPPVRASSRP